MDPKDETAHEMLAILEGKQGKCPNAVEHFLLSADAIRNHPFSLEMYGYCLVQTKQHLKAVPIFEQLAAQLPDQTYPKYDLAVVLVGAKEYEAALKVLEPSLAMEQPDPDILSLASDAYEASGNTPKAVSLLRQAIVLSPANADYYVAFAALCLDHESFQVGIDMINVGLQRISDDPSLYISRASSMRNLRNTTKRKPISVRPNAWIRRRVSVRMPSTLPNCKGITPTKHC